jgi:hypothetical protein
MRWNARYGKDGNPPSPRSLAALVSGWREQRARISAATMKAKTPKVDAEVAAPSGCQTCRR